MLQIAVGKALRTFCHDHWVSTEFFEGITKSKIHFMGFVSRHMKQGYLSSFHPVSFVLFRTDVYSSSTVVICTLTTRNHVQSNMQDRLLQLVQIYQYQAHNIKFSMIISNELVGIDITLNYYSCFGYTRMGFETLTVTQDRDDMDGYFGIMTHHSIPVLQYGNSFTWVKYGYMVLHLDMIHKLKPGQDTSYCNALMSFLQTDVKGFVSFQPFESLHDDIDNYINNLVHGEMTVTQQIILFDQILSITTKDSNEIFSFLEGKAREATIVSFSVFSNLFHQRFTWHRFLESTLEILQQFNIAKEKCDKQYHLFPGDQYQYSVKCMRCHKCVLSTTLGIGDTLLNAPSAILRHWNILRTHDADWEVPSTSLPLLFTSTESYGASKTSFENLFDTTDDVLCYPYFCSDKRFGEYIFL
jgi:hypothetical protein